MPPRAATVATLLAAAVVGCGGNDEARSIQAERFWVPGPLQASQQKFTLHYEHSNCDLEWVGTRLRKTRDAYIVTALVHPLEGNCAGVGLSPANRRTFRLPEPLAGRALITDQGRYVPAVIVVPPADNASARRLVTGDRLAFYGEISGACAKVALVFQGVPRDQWCSDGR